MCVDVLVFCFLVDMYQKISREKKQCAIELLSVGVKPKSAAKVYGISYRTLRRAKKNLRDHGNVEGIQKKRGPRPSIGDALTEVPFLPYLSNEM